MQAQVIMRGAHGKSLLDHQGPLTAKDTAQYRVEESDLLAATQALERLGFAIRQESSFGFSIEGEEGLFRDTFGLRPSDEQASGDQIPESLRAWIVSVAPSSPPEMFR